MVASAPRASAGAPAMSPAQLQAAQQSANWDYLRRSIQKYAVCPPAAGAGISQTYVAGQTLIYDVPTANGGYLDELLFECALTVNPATGTAAAYALNAGSPWTLFDRVIVEYGGRQIELRPYLLKVLAQLAGYERAFPEQVNSGQSVSFVSNTVWGTFAITVNTNNPWNFWFRIPLRMLPRRPAGMLPIMADSTRAQVKVVCASSALGPDPILNTVATTGGTGAAVTVGGTVKVVGMYRDGTNLTSPQPLTLALANEPTVQYLIDRQLNPLTAGSVLRQRIDAKGHHLYVISLIVDGNQSTKFAADSNIAGIELDQDFAGQNAFYRFGVQGSNVNFIEFRERFRTTYGQDVDEGVIPWVPGPAMYGLNPDNQEGGSYLNTLPGGWTDVSYGVQVTSVSSATFTPRIETYIVTVNPQGLVHN